VRIVLDTAILVRATEKSHGPAREVLHSVIVGHTLLLSNELLVEVARVLRYPRLQRFYKLSEASVYEFVRCLREAAEIVALSPLLIMPIRDVNDIIVLQTAIIGEADVLCTTDEAFYAPPASEFLKRAGIVVADDISLLQQLRS